MSTRGSIILSRFPRHLELDEPGKRAGAIVATLANDLDVQLGQLGDIRRAHRLADSPTPLDILRSAGLHGIGEAATEPVARRLAAIAELVPADTIDEAAIDALSKLIMVDPGAVGDDEAAAWSTVATALLPLTEFSGGLEPFRDVVRGVIAVHRSGNGTARGLLEACAAYLGLVTEHVAHSDDRWWHLATCRDLLAPRPLDIVEEPVRDLVAVEENPPHGADVGPVDRRHGECFAIVRGGLEAVPVDVVVTGKENRTIGPMVVNRDTGSGIVFEDVVPDGSELRFFADGRVQLDGTAVGSRSYSFRGSVFADGGGPVATDFVFAVDDDATTDPPLAVEAVLPHHTAYWAVTEPVVDAFDGGGDFPHADGLVEPVWLARGRTRWAVFVGAATFALGRADGEIEISQPRYEAGVFDRSVYEPDPAAPSSLGLGFEWQEREPFAVRVWIPSRFSALDTDGEIPVRDRLRSLLDRHRATGVHVRVEYADPRWVLGTGILRSLDSTHPLGIVVTGTTLWDDDTEQPT